MYTERINKAIEVASICHENQYRKNPERRIPYIAHPIAVGMMLTKYGYSEEVVVAGILHDILEDTEFTENQLKSEFGEAVASLVRETSEEDKSLPWEERKARYIKHLKTASEEAKAISCCDKIHNMESMINSTNAGGDIWSSLKRGKDKQIWRFTEMMHIFGQSLQKEMVDEYERLLKKLQEI